MQEKNNRFVTFYMTFGSIVQLNLIFILFCLPVVTIGGSVTAVYSVALKLVRHEEGKIWGSFWEAFKKNFKRATLTWLFVLVVGFVIYGELTLIFSGISVLGNFYKVVVVIEIALVALTLPFLFPLIARYDNSFWNTIKNAFLLSISQLGSWIKIAVAWVVPITLTVIYPVILLYTWYLWLIFGFGLIVWGTSFTVRKVFDKITNTQKNLEEEKAAAEAELEKQKEKVNKAPVDKNVASIREQMALVHQGRENRKKKKK